ncbi:hypothetical protein RJ639_008681 [Escallonia herrerae]|uniref:Fe2OG dioxygenase domain-containing protein n=1 Tax=Escallonia herrerae TaxID=1293975 RepID=A0AA88VZ41_9ASTE|nr:hypothetical protein RJ639_008681 [Escallonia herrerae]
MRPWYRATVATGVLGDLGGSLPVQNVQALASKNPEDIPLPYIRQEIPVIDMSNLVIGQVGYDEELAKLHRSIYVFAKSVGKVPLAKTKHFTPLHESLLIEALLMMVQQLINHGASEAIEHMKVVTEEFFKLPLEEKMACAQVPNNIEGYGQAFVVSEDQKLDWGDMLFILPLPASRRNLSFWPQNPTSFKSTLEEYSSKLQSISMSLLGLMARNLGVNPEELTNKVMSLAPHSDSVGLTLLIQVNEVQGLQIKKNHKWVPIEPIPGAIIINIGDVLEILSNGEYISIEHRATVNVEKERLSIATFHSPNMEAKIGPLPDFAEKGGAKYKTISIEDYVKLAVSKKLDGKSLLDQYLRIKH